MLDRLCQNCGKKEPMIELKVIRHREVGGGSRNETWCLECVQGKNPTRKQFELPEGWE